MLQILIRFLVGGLVVSAFALLGDLLKPKSFAGLFGGAPSVALATLALTAAGNGASYAATEARSMIAGAVAFFVYAFLVTWLMMRYQPKAVYATVCSLPVWLGTAFGLWYSWIR